MLRHGYFPGWHKNAIFAVMKILRTLLAAFLLAVPVCLGAQTKAETSLFNKTIAKPSLKAADKFLKK